MNIDITVAHCGDLDGADEGFVYEDLDRECDTVALIAEAYGDMAVGYAGFETEVREIVDDEAKILVRLTRPICATVVA